MGQKSRAFMSDGLRLSRRRLLVTALGGAASMVGLPALAAAPERRLLMRNLHTNETLDVAFWRGGHFLPQGLARINHLLRDHRREEIFPIATALLDVLHALARRAGAREPFQVISGYRSPQTNRLLRVSSSGVAKRSYHMLGKAVDIRLPGCDLLSLHRHALALRCGGVGLYRRSDFVHLDVGPVRQWVG